MRKIIVIQGDSITDAGRDKKNPNGRGNGYAQMVAGELGAANPGEYTVYNRGVSGNRIVDLYARIKQDIINLQPDYVSVLIGVNDVWHEYNYQNGVSPEKFEKIYGMLIEELQEAVPNVKLMLLEPFILPGDKTVNNEEHPNRWEFLNAGVRAQAAAAKRVAEKYALPFVPLQEIFEEMDAKVPGDWTVDGVHPTAAGHTLIKQQWLKTFAELG